MSSVEYLRRLGFNRVTLKTGSYGMEELAMAIKFSTDAELDLLTIDGSGGGTGMSPWNMMQSWGVPSIILHSKAHEYANMLAAKGRQVVDMSFAGVSPSKTISSRPWPWAPPTPSWSAWDAAS